MYMHMQRDAHVRIYECMCTHMSTDPLMCTDIHTSLHTHMQAIHACTCTDTPHVHTHMLLHKHAQMCVYIAYSHHKPSSMCTHIHLHTWEQNKAGPARVCDGGPVREGRVVQEDGASCLRPRPPREREPPG